MNFDQFRELLVSDRSIRRFKEAERVGHDTLLKLVELTRYCASGRNLQPLRYKLVSAREECERVFPLLKWAGYLSDWDGPVPGERPSAYLVQCLDTAITTDCLCDDGLQLQAITLGAAALGIGGCIIKSFNAPLLKKELELPERVAPLYVLALGYPLEKVVVEKAADTSDIRYYRTPDEVHHVPKRLLEELIL